ncbi:hypothetical protein [Flexibacterium corallicola]|uniref:hypothetical protein n=1 Tax=Flexibacterium corallicola TaxID=3037259 RepID=UPI00286F52AB|nr:hypothetical protein [Pseudovibrio sp. M1P-2-3]
MTTTIRKFANSIGLIRRRHTPCTSTQATDIARDPLSHPDIQRMNRREQADLPIDPRAVIPE